MATSDSPDIHSHHRPITRRAYKIHEAADALGVTPITIRRMIDRGLIRPCRALRHVLIPVDEIEKLLNR
jgi:excisionase family DNA binding protein